MEITNNNYNNENSFLSSTPNLDLTMDLHEALQEVPLSTEYFTKLEIYGDILIKKYNWRKVQIFKSPEDLEKLVTGTRIITRDNSFAIKHTTGWVILNKDGYVFSHIDSNSVQLSLPAMSIPENYHPSPDDISLNLETDDISNEQKQSQPPFT